MNVSQHSRSHSQHSLSQRDCGAAIPLNDLPATIGRGPDCDVRLCDRWVSRVHCEIKQIDGRLVILDLESKHGTFVNKKRVRLADLLPGDTVRLGTTCLVVEEGGRTLRVILAGGEKP